MHLHEYQEMDGYPVAAWAYTTPPSTQPENLKSLVIRSKRMNGNGSRKNNADGNRWKPLYILTVMSLVAAFVFSALPMSSVSAAPAGPGGSGNDSNES